MQEKYHGSHFLVRQFFFRKVVKYVVHLKKTLHKVSVYTLGSRHKVVISPSLRHWRIRPPEDMFFSASISLKLRELENTNTSTITMRRDRKVMAVSEDMPCVASMLSNSVFVKDGEGGQKCTQMIH